MRDTIAPDRQIPEKLGASVDVVELQRQLQESSKRLSEANLKLRGLVRVSDAAEEDHNKILRPRESLLTIVKVNSSVNEDDLLSGTIGEVVSSPSGNIEVTERRYADV